MQDIIADEYATANGSEPPPSTVQSSQLERPDDEQAAQGMGFDRYLGGLLRQGALGIPQPVGQPAHSANVTDDPIALLLLAVAGQDRAAFRHLYNDTGAKLLGVLLRILGSRSEAEDALQEVFTRVWLRAGRYDATKGRGMTWLIALSRHHAIDRLRSRPNHVSDDLAMAQALDTTPCAEMRMVAKGEALRIGKCFATLEPDRAAMLRGAYLDGHSYMDLAARYDVPLNTMRTWLRRSLIQVRKCMDA